MALSAVLAWQATGRVGPRGLNLTRHTTVDWSGDPTSTTVARHVDFGPELSRNRLQLPPNTSLVYSGLIYIPRRGEYEFGVDSSDSVWVTIGDNHVVNHRRGQAPDAGALQLDEGLHSIRIRLQHRSGESDLSLTWRPPGFSGLVPLSPVLLHPDVPEPDAAPYWFALAAIATLAAGGLLAAFPALHRVFTHALRPDLLLIAGVSVFSLAVAVPLVLYVDETRDEWTTALISRLSISNLAHGYFDSAYWTLGSRNPPLGHYFYGFLAHAFGTEALVVPRLAAALCGALTVFETVRFALPRLGRFVALVGGAVLSVLPGFMATNTTATLDAPGTLLFTVAITQTIAALQERRGSRDIVAAGVWVGIAVATRFTSGLVLGFGLLLHLISAARQQRREGHATLPLALLLVPLLAVAVLLLVWPWLWRSPFAQALATMRGWEYTVTESFLGSQAQPPPSYLPIQFLTATPALVLIAVIAGIFNAGRPAARVERTVGLWALTPFLIVFSDLEADGARHLSIVWPAIALLAAGGIEYAFTRPAWRVPVGAVLIGYTAWQTATVVPYATTYRNELVGGPGTAWSAGLFPTALLGEGLAGAARYVDGRLSPGASWRYEGPTESLFALQVRASARRATEGNEEVLIRASPEPGRDFEVGYLPGWTLRVEGAPLVVVFLRDGTEAARRERGQSPKVSP